MKVLDRDGNAVFLPKYSASVPIANFSCFVILLSGSMHTVKESRHPLDWQNVPAHEKKSTEDLSSPAPFCGALLSAVTFSWGLHGVTRLPAAVYERPWSRGM